MVVTASLNENDSISHPKMSTSAAVFKKLRKGKTIIHLSDDIIIASLHAADITDPLWDSLADMAVGAVLLIVSLIELGETNEELKELNEELITIRKKIRGLKPVEDTLFPLEVEVKTIQEKNELIENAAQIPFLEEQKRHLENQIYWNTFNKYLCMSSIALSATYTADMALNTGANAAARFGYKLLLNQLGNAGLVIGMTTVPVVIMFLILIKQCIDLWILYDQRDAQIKICTNTFSSEQEKAEAKAKIEEINHKIFYKKGEIFAQTLITASFLLGVIALSGATFGAAPLALVIIAATIGTLLKLHEIYTNTQRELQKKNETIQNQKEAIQNTELGKNVLHEALKDTNDMLRVNEAKIEDQKKIIEQLQRDLAMKDKRIEELEQKSENSPLSEFSQFKKVSSLLNLRGPSSPTLLPS